MQPLTPFISLALFVGTRDEQRRRLKTLQSNDLISSALTF
jgi:hypothetical protein